MITSQVVVQKNAGISSGGMPRDRLHETTKKPDLLAVVHDLLS